MLTSARWLYLLPGLVLALYLSFSGLWLKVLWTAGSHPTLEHARYHEILMSLGYAHHHSSDAPGALLGPALGRPELTTSWSAAAIVVTVALTSSVAGLLGHIYQIARLAWTDLGNLLGYLPKPDTPPPRTDRHFRTTCACN